MARKAVTLDAEALYADRDLYFRTCLKINPKAAHELIPFALKKEQRRFFEAIDLERRRGRAPKIVVLKSRRVGISTAAEAELFKECHLRANKQALVVAHVADSADAIFQMSQRFYLNLPEGMKPPRKYATKKLIHFDHNDSRMQVVVAGESRGYTAQYVHISELAFIEDADTLMTAILHTVADDPQTLVVAESTPNGMGNYFHQLWINAVAGKNDWVPFFSPWFEDETYVMKPWFETKDLSPHDAKLMADHSLTLPQMAWYINTRENKCNGDQNKMDQENASDAVSCFLASGSKVFDQGLPAYLDAAEKAQLAEVLPPECEIEANPLDKRAPLVRVVKRGRWRIYRPPQPRHLYIVGADTGSGEPGGDYTPIVVFNRHTLDVDAVFYSKLHPDLQAREAAMIAWWYNGAVLAGEANNHGVLFFDELLKRTKYYNIFYRRVNEESVSGKVGDKPGFWTSDSNRSNLYNLPRRYIRDGLGKCLDGNLLKEMAEMYYDDSRKPQHPKNGFADGVTALAFCLYVHMGTYDGTLEPLPLEQVGKAVTLARDNRVRRSMGLKEEPIDLAQLTMDQIEKMDADKQARDRSRQKSGLGGHR